MNHLLYNHWLIFIVIKVNKNNIENFGWICKLIFLMYYENIWINLKWIYETHMKAYGVSKKILNSKWPRALLIKWLKKGIEMIWKQHFYGKLIKYTFYVII
jgi:hypothetical protein